MSLITKAGQLNNTKLTYVGMIYGQPGVGKTTLALSSNKPLLIDIDKGLYRVEARYQTDSLQVDNYKQILELLSSQEIQVYNTLVFDTMGKLIDRIGDYVSSINPKLKQGNGQLTMQGWGQVKITFQNLIKTLQGLNKSVLFVAHESEEKDGEDTKKRPDVSGSARKDIIKELDFLGYMEIQGGKRTISFNPSEKYYAKNSCGLYEVLVVDSFNKTGANNFIQEKIEKALIEKRNKDAEMLEKYNTLIASQKAEIENLTKETINDYFKKLVDVEIIWDSKLVLWKELENKATSLGVSFDKEKGLFV